MSSANFRSAIVLGGRGALGSLLCRRLRASGVGTVYSLDLRATDDAPDAHALVGDVCALDRSTMGLVGGCELVILALPAAVAERCLEGVAKSLSPDAVLIETLSVKTRLHELLGGLQPRTPYLGINPMFAPDLGFEGRPVIVVGNSHEQRARGFVSLLKEWGAEVAEMDADRHDRVLATLQAVTHAAVLCFGLALDSLEYRLDTLASIAPPPHRAMIALLARIASNDPEVYRDIQADNPYAAEARRGLARGLGVLEKAIASSSDFARVLVGIRALLGPQRERWNEGCVRMFSALESESS
jgi:prephenate dehydrogenase